MIVTKKKFNETMLNFNKLLNQAYLKINMLEKEIKELKSNINRDKVKDIVKTKNKSKTNNESLNEIISDILLKSTIFNESYKTYFTEHKNNTTRALMAAYVVNEITSNPLKYKNKINFKNSKIKINNMVANYFGVSISSLYRAKKIINVLDENNNLDILNNFIDFDYLYTKDDKTIAGLNGLYTYILSEYLQ